MRAITIACIALIAALGATGIATGTPKRHLIQTAPIWIAIALGIRRVPAGKWVAFAYCFFWLAMQAVVWSYLLRPTDSVLVMSWIEKTLSIAIAVASIAGIVSCLRFKGGVRPIAAVATFIVSGLMQVIAFLISVSPSFAQR